MATSRAPGETLAASDLRERAMSLDHQAKTGFHPGPPRRGRTRPVLLVVGVVAAVVVIAGVVGVVANSQDTGVVTQTLPTPSSVPAATVGPTAPAVPVLPEQEAILTQYRAFWAILTPASRAKPEARRAMLETVAVDPSLTRTLNGMRASDSIGEVAYGQEVVRPELVSADGGTATLRDCQDGSAAGRVKVATGEKVTVGVKDALAIVTMQRGADAVWRVSTVEYQPAGSCSAPA